MDYQAHYSRGNSNFNCRILLWRFFLGIRRARILATCRNKEHKYNEYKKLFHLL